MRCGCGFYPRRVVTLQERAEESAAYVVNGRFDLLSFRRSRRRAAPGRRGDIGKACCPRRTLVEEERSCKRPATSEARGAGNPSMMRNVVDFVRGDCLNRERHGKPIFCYFQNAKEGYPPLNRPDLFSYLCIQSMYSHPQPRKLTQ